MLNEISTTTAQVIIPHPSKARQFSLHLSPLLWQMTPEVPVILSHDGKDLVAVYRRENNDSLTIQVLPQIDSKPIHVHLYGSHVERYGKLAIHTAGRLSIYMGLYSSLDAEAREIFLNNDERNLTAVKKRIHVSGNLSLQSERLLVQKAEVQTRGQSFVKSRKIKLHAPFSSIERNSLHASLITINKAARLFSGHETKIFADHLQVHGFIKAPIINLVIKKQARWYDPRSTTYEPQIRAQHLGLLVDTMVFENTQLQIKRGMWANGTYASGLATFVIGGSQNWHFPKTSKRLQLPDMLGCYFEVTNILFDSKTKFNIASGATKINSSYAKIGDIINGMYNRSKVHLDVKNHLTIKGMLKAFEVEMEGLRASIPGKIFATTLRSRFDDLDISGVVSTTKMSTIGTKLSVAKMGSVSTDYQDFNHQSVEIAGQLSATTAVGRSDQFSVTNGGKADLSTANLTLKNTTVSGLFSSQNFSIGGNEFSLNSNGKFTADRLSNKVPIWKLNGGGMIKSFVSAIPQLFVSSSSSYPIPCAKISGNACALTGLEMRTLAADVTDVKLSNLTVDNSTIRGNRCALNKVNIDNAIINSNACESINSTIEHANITGTTCSINGGKIGNASINATDTCSLNNVAIEHANINADTCSLNNVAIEHANINADTCSLNNVASDQANVNANTCTTNNVDIKRANINAVICRMTGDYCFDDARITASEIAMSGSASMRSAVINADNLSMSGRFTIADATLSALNWSLAHKSVLDGKVHLDVEYGLIHGHLSGPSCAGRIDNAYFADTAQVEDDEVSLHGKFFNSCGSLKGESGIWLDYTAYVSMGALSSDGQLGMRINDRVVDEKLLHQMERDFGFRALYVSTDQELSFDEDFYFGHDLSLSASKINLTSKPRITFVNKLLLSSKLHLMERIDPHHRSRFHVDGRLELDSRDHDLNVNNFNVRASSLAAHTGKMMRVHNSAVLTIGDQVMSADGGFVFSPLVTDHYSETHRSTHGGFGSKTTTTSWQELDRSVANSLKGRIEFISENGGATFDSTTLTAADGVFAETKFDINNLERNLETRTTVKKNKPFSFSRQDIFQEHDAPTYMVGGRFVSLRSLQGRMHMPSSVFMAEEVMLRAKGNVHLSAPSLHTRIDMESLGLSYSNFITQLVDDPTRALLSCNPITNACMNVRDACATNNGVNVASAGVMAGIQLTNAMDMLGSITANFLGQISFNQSSSSFQKTAKGEGGIYSNEMKIISDDGDIETLNGFELVCENGLVKCENGTYVHSGFKEITESESSSGSVGVSMSSVSCSMSQSESERVEYLEQRVVGNIKIDARDEICLDKPLHEHSENFGFSMTAGATGGSFSLAHNGNSFGASYSAPNNKTGAIGSASITVNGTTVAAPLMPKNEVPQVVLVVNEAPAAKSESIVVADVEKTDREYRAPRDAVDKRVAETNTVLIDSEASEQNMHVPLAVEKELDRIATTIPEEISPREFGYLDHASGAVVGTAKAGWKFVVGAVERLGAVGMIVAARQAQDTCFTYGGDEEACSTITDLPVVKASEDSVKNYIRETADGAVTTFNTGKNIAIVYSDSLSRVYLVEDFGVDEAFAYPGTESYQQATEELLTMGQAISRGADAFRQLSGPTQTELFFEGFTTATLSLWAGRVAGKFLTESSGDVVSKIPTKTVFKNTVDDLKAGSWASDDMRHSQSLTHTKAYADYKRLLFSQGEINTATKEVSDIIEKFAVDLVKVNNQKRDAQAPFLVVGNVKAEMMRIEGPQELAYMMRRVGYNGQPVTLLGSNAGASLLKEKSQNLSDKVQNLDETFAQRLANHLDVPVTAPNGVVKWEKNYNVSIIKKDFHKLTRFAKKAESLSEDQRLQLAHAYHQQRRLRLTEAAELFVDESDRHLSKGAHKLIKQSEQQIEAIRNGAVKMSADEVKKLYQDASPFFGEFKVFYPESSQNALVIKHKSEMKVLRRAQEFSSLVAIPLIGYLIEKGSQ